MKFLFIPYNYIVEKVPLLILKTKHSLFHTPHTTRSAAYLKKNKPSHKLQLKLRLIKVQLLPCLKTQLCFQYIVLATFKSSDYLHCMALECHISLLTEHFNI